MMSLFLAKYVYLLSGPDEKEGKPVKWGCGGCLSGEPERELRCKMSTVSFGCAGSICSSNRPLPSTLSSIVAPPPLSSSAPPPPSLSLFLSPSSLRPLSPPESCPPPPVSLVLPSISKRVPGQLADRFPSSSLRPHPHRLGHLSRRCCPQLAPCLAFRRGRARCPGGRGRRLAHPPSSRLDQGSRSHHRYVPCSPASLLLLLSFLSRWSTAD